MAGGGMPRKPTPWFPLYASELLTDEKTEMLEDAELGIVIRLWSKMWINGVERGTLLLDEKTPIPDEKIAKFLHRSLEEWLQIKEKLVNQIMIIKVGENGELYSKRLRNFKTKWELYGDSKRKIPESKKTPKRKIPERNRTTELEVELEVESEVELEKNKRYLPLSENLKQLIHKNNPRAKITEGQIKDWANDVRLMVERDGRTVDEIIELIEFSQGHRFWKINILSMGSLREKFDRLTLEMNEKKNPRRNESGICGACKKQMANMGDEWFCSDCGHRTSKTKNVEAKERAP